MKNTLLFLFVITAFSTSQSLFATPGDDFDIETKNGNMSLSQYKGKVVYLDFWASWCSPCRKSFPWMNKMQAKYGDKGLKIIGISLDGSKDATTKFLKKNPALFLIAYDPDGKVADNYGVQVMPTSYLIGKDGKLLMTHKGFRTKHEDMLEDEFKKALGL